jgi:translation initiation factor 1
MPKLTSLADLTALLPDDYSPEAAKSQPTTKTGYDGKAQTLTVVKEKRASKVVTLVRGFQSNPTELQDITTTLKKQCGAGGRVLDNEIELQGDHSAKVASFLTAQGFRVAPAKRPAKR